MVFVQGGTFTQGDREVTLSDFELGKYPVTQALWEAVMGEGSNPSWFKGPRRPVEGVSWYDAVAFCNRLNALEDKNQVCYFSDDECTQPYGLEGELPVAGPMHYKPTLGAFRLPIQAEWEYAALGGPLNQGCACIGSDRCKDVAWFRGIRYVQNKDTGETQPVGLLQPNCLGLYDMEGNVSEWCWDEAASTSPNETPLFRKLCGECWADKKVKDQENQTGNPEYRDDDVGFRLARHFNTI